ncbi:CatA-like O-acetyltransferase [Aestuariibius sp. 2305UL40-4]|uniref:CatA-like O-acetyltransferase n=1 Tax=Aestuariibius violaceus TaxID=3234132 RepID=UPI00345EA94A
MRKIDLDSWERTDQFRFFRGFERPHYATTARIDVTRLLAERKAEGMNAYRACLYAIGAGLHAVPELCMRFEGDEVYAFDRLDLSMTVPREDGTFRYAYVSWQPDFVAFDAMAADLIDRARRQDALNANTGGLGVAYLSCMPWLDYSSINNAMPGPDDCVPRINWGKFVHVDRRWDMAMTIEVHHALVDGRQVGAYFAAVQDALDVI